MRFLVVLAARVLLALSVLTVAVTAVAQDYDADALIEKGQSMFDEQRYEESIQTLSAVVARKDLPSTQRISALRLMAYNHIVLGNLGQAKGVVWSIYAEDEDYVLGEGESPRFREFFEKHKKTWIDAGRPGKAKNVAKVDVRIKHSPPSQAEPDLAISLTGTVEDPDANVVRLNLYYRTGSEGKFETAPVKFAMRKFNIDIPAEFVQAPHVDYYIEAVDSQNIPVANRGDAEAPLRVTIRGEESSVITSPWLWVPVSVAVVAAIVIPVVLFATGAVGSSDSTVSVNVFER